ncbi:hypothetical protein GCM10019059_32260 [Camelimonas fluminis]|uniref:Bacteriophage protein n=1 Tax=Camelimonas fluminis TaxID=1576911 RepID=A0ABV7UHK7_9HYPH|nr:hypothetical protein [Camelimonas fluminis]GHE70035.1 hypothetical protein GCM10019059_32260 [Camelimonas fluminis]
MTTTIKVDRLGEVLKRIKDLAKNQVLVGVPDSNAARRDEGEAISNAEIGYINEFGAPEANIPARQHLIPGVQEALPEVTKRLKAGAAKAMAGDKKAGDTALHAVGLAAQNAVRTKIDNGPFAALADTTIADRVARGRTGQKPLIDTGQYRNSITYVTRPRGQKGS